MSIRRITILVQLAILVSVSACGKTGKLYLPEDKAAAAKTLVISDTTV